MKYLKLPESTSAKSSKRYNLGWALLRPFLCFLVILEHFWIHEVPLQKSWQIPFDMITGISVPCFMFISFYLVEKHISNGSQDFLRKRIRRIGWPLVGWALIYFVVLAIASFRFERECPSAKDLVWQATTGHSAALNQSMWFQFVLLVLTVGLFYLVRLTPRHLLASLSLLLVAAMISIWSGFNEWLFGDLRFELSYPLGRLAEMVPFAVLGFAAARYGILERSLKYRRYLFPLFLLLTVISVWLLTGYRERGFGYSGFFFLPTSLCLVLAMWHAPLGNLGWRTEKALLFLCSFTLGIYCLHRLVFLFVQKGLHFTGLNIGTFGMCAGTYIVSFGVAYLMSKSPWKRIRELVS